MNKAGCDCKACKSACSYKPGWFLPNQAEKVAEFLNIPFIELFNTKLGVDWNNGYEDETVFVLAPAIKSMDTGEEYPSDPRGVCVFFIDGLCEIHNVKPFECAEFLHSDSQEMIEIRKRKIVKEWAIKGDYIKNLLGREPQSEEFSTMDMLFGGF